MSCYVDDMCNHTMGKFGRMKMSHLIADTEPELHEMAIKIGVARKWFQGDHYDVAKSKRHMAIAFGARAIPMKLLSMMVSNRRRGLGLGTPETAEAIFRERVRETFKTAGSAGSDSVAVADDNQPIPPAKA